MREEKFLEEPAHNEGLEQTCLVSTWQFGGLGVFQEPRRGNRPSQIFLLGIFRRIFVHKKENFQ